MRVEFSASSIYDVFPGQRSISISADMTIAQIQDAVVYLLGSTLGEPTMYEFVKAEFPDWFKEPA